MLTDLNEILRKAQKECYGVGLFNTIDTDMLDAVISAAEDAKSPIIIGTAEVLLPYGELDLIAPALVAAAKRASVPVAVHYDHGLTFERCVQALRCGFSSVMFDGSASDIVENVRQTREMVRIAHAFGATVEGEIGHVGQADDQENEQTSGYTSVREAVDFVEQTGVDVLAVAIGTAHGAYKNKPRLDFQRLREIRNAVSVPLVLHGGSGLSDDDFRNAIRGGIVKVNIFTDLCLAGTTALRTALAQKDDYLTAHRYKVEAIKATVLKKIAVFGSGGKG